MASTRPATRSPRCARTSTCSAGGGDGRRTRTLSETRGFLKALIEQDGDRILGFTAFGVEAGEVMAAVQVAMVAGLPYTVLRDMVLTHPTMAEGLGVLLAGVPAMMATTRAHAAS